MDSNFERGQIVIEVAICVFTFIAMLGVAITMILGAEQSVRHHSFTNNKSAHKWSRGSYSYHGHHATRRRRKGPRHDQTR